MNFEQRQRVALIAESREIDDNSARELARELVWSRDKLAANPQTIAALRDAALMVVDWYEGKNLPDRTAMYNAACAALAMLAMVKKGEK